jgi:DNA-binding NtrC family response regulator
MTVVEMVNSGVSYREIENMVLLVAVKQAVKIEGGHSQRAAERLGVHRNTVSRMLVRAGLRQKVGGKPGVDPHARFNL